jgi:monomeric sarcosine oxidase
VRSYSHIVVGAGALGAAAAYWLARLGTGDVLVLEQFELGHQLGASEDHSRIIRHSYHSSDYTALTPSAYASWAELEDETGLQLVVKTGGLDLARLGTAGVQEIDNYRNSLRTAEIDWEDLDADAIRRRYPQWRIDDDVVAMYQQDTGLVDIRRATAAHLARAREMGVTVKPNMRVTDVRSTDSEVTIAAGDEVYGAESAVLCVASWLPRLADALGLTWTMTLSEEQVTYFATAHLRQFAPDRFPVFIWHGDDYFYGFPVYGEAAVKLSRDMRGRWTTLEQRSYEIDHDEELYIQRFAEQYLPEAVGPILYSKACVYDMPPDRNFVIDLIPGHSRVAMAAGAGHAAKFAGVIGQALAQLALTGSSDHPIAPFALDRPALTDPNFPPTFRLEGRGDAGHVSAGPGRRVET